MNKKVSLKISILWWFSIFIVSLFIIFNVLLFNIIKEDVYNKLKESLSVVAINIERSLISTNTHDLKTVLSKLDYQITPIVIKVFTKNKLITTFSDNKYIDIKLNRYIDKDKEFFIVHIKKYGDIAIYLLKTSSPNKKYIVVGTPTDKIDLNLNNILIKILFLSSILLVLFIIGSNLILNTILLNPIKNITKVANEVSVGNLDRTIPLPIQKDEIYDLVQSFDKMVLRLRDGVEMMEKFNSDISHELKTPLTVLKGELEIALRKERTIDYYKHTLKVSLNEVNYLIELVEEILCFSKIEVERDKSEEVYVDELLLEVISKLSKQAKQENVFLHLKRLDSISLYINSALLKTVFINILNNAIKYTPENKNIYISLIKENKKILFIVKDEGIGISKEEINKIMTRFYRSEKSRNREIKGFGLGLSIVERVLKILNGTIKFKSEENKGTTVIIELENIRTI